jgi:hypothetical protein
MLEVRPSRPSCCLGGEVQIRAGDLEQRVSDTDAPYEVSYLMELLQAVQVDLKEAGRFIALWIIQLPDTYPLLTNLDAQKAQGRYS